jgi:hypothetical protein
VVLVDVEAQHMSLQAVAAMLHTCVYKGGRHITGGGGGE